MRPAYTLKLEHGCIFIKWSGAVTTHDIIASNREIAQDPRYRSVLDRLVDLRRAKIKMSSSDEMRTVAREVAEKLGASEGHRKAAMLVAGDHEYGLLRVLNAMTDQTHWDVRPFRRLDEAVSWLDLPEDLGDPFDTMTQD